MDDVDDDSMYLDVGSLNEIFPGLSRDDRYYARSLIERFLSDTYPDLSDAMENIDGRGFIVRRFIRVSPVANTAVIGSYVYFGDPDQHWTRWLSSSDGWRPISLEELSPDKRTGKRQWQIKRVRGYTDSYEVQRFAGSTAFFQAVMFAVATLEYGVRVYDLIPDDAAYFIPGAEMRGLTADEVCY